MKNKYHRKGTASGLGRYAYDFIRNLLKQGYLSVNMSWRTALIKEFDDWLIYKDIQMSSLTKDHISRFVLYKNKHSASKSSSQYVAVLKRLLIFLSEKGCIKETLQSENLNEKTGCISGFTRYLAEDLGLMWSTINGYAFHVREFLQWRFKTKKLHLNKISPKNITEFFVAHAQKRKTKITQSIATSLRSFFTFLYRKGMTSSDLTPIVPSTAAWDQASIPEHLSGDDLKKLLNSCDRKTALGLRDFAILMLLSRLGIRASEVLKLTLDDIDWDSGEITIRGKGSKISQFPLVVDVGEALVAYLKKGRPPGISRSLFICASPPHRGFKKSSTVSTIVESALKRAGIHTRKKGAHLLRHTFATDLLQHGSSLQEVGQTLQHCSINTTAIYAKVDFQRLSLVAIPWPLKKQTRSNNE
jgi:site-specific recombinase XerD